MREWFVDSPNSTRTLATLICLVGTLMFLAPASVVAQDDTGSERSVDKETAKEVLKLLRSGKKSYKAEDYQAAYDKFTKAYEMWPRPAILVRLGRTAEELGKSREAIDHYEAFLEEKPDAKIASKIEKKVEKLKASAVVLVSLRSQPGGAEVYLGSADGERLGRTPLETEVEPGERTFLFRAEEYQDAERTVNVSGDEQTVSVEMEAEKSQPDTFAKATTDTEPTQSAPSTKGVATFGWISTLVGIAGVGTGAAFTAMQGQVVEDVNKFNRGVQGASRSKLESMKEDAQSHYRMSLIAYSAGGALGAVGIGMLTYHFLSKGSANADKSTASLTPGGGMTPGGGWAGFRIRF